MQAGSFYHAMVGPGQQNPRQAMNYTVSLEFVGAFTAPQLYRVIISLHVQPIMSCLLGC
jgi:hypothetical protein